MERYIPAKKQVKQQRKNAGIKPGIYNAEVISVGSPEGFAAGQAIDVIYHVNIGGSIVYYTERFLIANQQSPRTQGFEKFLDSIGADLYEDIVGLELQLTFAYVVNNGKTWCNIIDRKLLNEVNADECNC